MNAPLLKLPDTVEERFARAMQLYHAQIIPSWDDLPPVNKKRIVEDMKSRIEFLARHGVGVVMLEEKK